MQILGPYSKQTESEPLEVSPSSLFCLKKKKKSLQVYSDAWLSLRTTCQNSGWGLRMSSSHLYWKLVTKAKSGPLPALTILEYA
jgi:hypothetical protein